MLHNKIQLILYGDFIFEVKNYFFGNISLIDDLHKFVIACTVLETRKLKVKYLFWPWKLNQQPQLPIKRQITCKKRHRLTLMAAVSARAHVRSRLKCLNCIFNVENEIRRKFVKFTVSCFYNLKNLFISPPLYPA